MPKSSLSLLFACLSLFASLSYFPLLAYAQTTTSIYVPLDLIPSGIGNVQGEVAGTGAGGTTYLLSGSNEPGVTATLVEGATDLSLGVVFTVTGTGSTATGAAAVSLAVECGYSGSGTNLPAICTAEGAESVGTFATTTTVTLSSESVQLVPIVVSTKTS